jgi:HEAT repeat protein
VRNSLVRGTVASQGLGEVLWLHGKIGETGRTVYEGLTMLCRSVFWIAVAVGISLGACKARRPGTRFEELVGALADGDRAGRLTAMDALVELGDTHAVAPLLARYRDRTEEGIVREVAIISVARLGEPRLVSYVMEQLPEALGRSDESSVRAYMLGKALVEGGARTLPAVIELARSQDPRVRDWAITLLGGYRGEPAALSTLLDVARSPDPQIRRRVIDSLGQLLMAEAAPAIQTALSDPDPTVRAAATFAWRNVSALLGDDGGR